MSVSFSAFAGSNVGYLICKSPSGRTFFSAELQDLYTFISAKYTIDQESENYGNDLCASVVFNGKMKVFTLTLKEKDGDRWINFYAIPSSFKTIKQSNGKQLYKFQAVIQGTDPRKDKYNSPEIILDCELMYSI